MTDLDSTHSCCGGDQPVPDVKHPGALCANERQRLVSSSSSNKKDEGGNIQGNLVADGSCSLGPGYSQMDTEMSPPHLVAAPGEVRLEEPKEIDRGSEINPEDHQEMGAISKYDDSFAEVGVPGIELDGGSEITKDSETSSKETGNEEADNDKERAQRMSGNGEKSSDGSKDLTVLKNHGVCKHKGRSGGRKAVYTRKEMEVLRYVNVKRQKKMWQEIYHALPVDLKKEYDELGSFKRRGDKGGTSSKNASQNPVSGNNGQRIPDNMCDVPSGIEITTSADCIPHSSSRRSLDGNSVSEEYEDEYSDDDDDEFVSIQRPAFYVEGEPDFDSGPPEDGWEYLRRVRWEAAHIPDVKVAKLDESKLKADQSVYMPLIPDIEKCPDHLRPSKQWEEEFLSDFSELRKALSQVIGDGQPVNLHSILKVGSQSREDPALSSLLKMDPVTRINTLRKRISLVEVKKVISRDDCLWLFSLCAVVHTPLDADTCASVRALLRKCAKLRAEKSELDDEVVMLNILVTISGKYFGQSEN